MLVAEIIIEQTAFSFDKPYSYAVPEHLKDAIKSGCRVVVSFGKGNSHRQGMVLNLREDSDDAPLKKIERLIDETPIISQEMIELCIWMHEHCFCTYFEAVKAVLPVGVSFKVSEIFAKGDTPFEEKYAFLDEFFAHNGSATRDVLLETFGELNDQKISHLVKSGCLVKDSLSTRKMGDKSLKSARLKMTEEQISECKLTPRQG